MEKVLKMHHFTFYFNRLEIIGVGCPNDTPPGLICYDK